MMRDQIKALVIPNSHVFFLAEIRLPYCVVCGEGTAGYAVLRAPNLVVLLPTERLRVNRTHLPSASFGGYTALTDAECS